MKNTEYTYSMTQKKTYSKAHDKARAAFIYHQILGLEEDPECPQFSAEVKAVKDFAEKRLQKLFKS